MSFTKQNIPDFLTNAGATLSDSSQRIDTDVLEPVIQTSTFMRFQLQNKGLLNPQSRITFQVQDPGTSAFFPLSIGIGSIVERATLKIGGKTICEVQDWAHYHAYKSMFIDTEVVKEREQFNTARALALGVVYPDAFFNRTAAVGVGNATGLVSRNTGLELGKEFTVDHVTKASTDMTLHTFQKLTQAPVFSVSLDDLLPCLRGIKFPLFMLAQGQDVQIELTLQPELGKRGSVSAAGDATKVFVLNQDETRLIADYTFLDGDEMDKFAAANRDFSYTFLEPRLTKTTLAVDTKQPDPAVAPTFGVGDWTQQVRNIGGAGRMVSKIIVGITSDKMAQTGTGAAADPYVNPGNQQKLINSYRAIAPESTAKGTYGRLTSNIRKNDTFLYPIDRKSSALHFHGVVDTEQALPSVTRDQYARQGYALTDQKFEGYTQSSQSELAGQAFYTAYRLNDGERVNSRGLELHSQISALDNDQAPYTSRCWIEVQKRMRMTDGVVETEFA